MDKCLDHKLQNPNQFARYYLLCVATATLSVAHSKQCTYVHIIHTESNKIIAKQQCYNTLTVFQVEVDQVFLCVFAFEAMHNVSFCCCYHVKEVLPHKCGVVNGNTDTRIYAETHRTWKCFIMNVEKDLQMSVTSLISHLIRFIRNGCEPVLC